MINTSLNSNITDNNNNNDFNIMKYLILVEMPLSLFGTMTNLINIIIFSNKRFKDKVFNYFLYHSLSEFLYLICIDFSFVPFCGSYCGPSIGQTYFAKFLIVYIFDYFTSSLAIFNILIEITISYQRLLTILNASFCGSIKNGSPHLITFIIFIISLIYYSPQAIFIRIIKTNSNETLNGYTYNIIGLINKDIFGYYETVVSIIRGPICVFILTVINIIILIKFKNQMNKKKNMKLKSE
jgi:hypothetical protein